MPQAIHISPIDNVVVALHPIAKGTLVEVDGLSVTALEDIPQGHKMAVKPIRNGENVIKYGFPIGHATADAVPRSPERCLSRQAGIVRCCLIIKLGPEGILRPQWGLFYALPRRNHRQLL